MRSTLRRTCSSSLRAGAWLAFAALTSLLPAAASAAPSIPVTVVNTPTVNANVTNATVGVSNSSAAPLFVTTQGAAASGVGSSCDVNLAASGSTTGTLQCQLSTVPAGKVLVIETLTCFALVVDGTPFSTLVLTTGSPNPLLPAVGPLSTLNHFLPLTRQASGDYGSLNAYGLISPVRIYAFGPTAANGGTVPIYVFGSVGYPAINGNPSLGCTMSGHLENQ
jgi:hypothetical protein